ncbi:putative amine oxidase [Cotonvirus japonicus]|uniref:Amine oxidase n=1 Tax=Cotonvirus japonicus TaxID=2811091 RepID=A0ABM7NTI5_9VIRU|nr:putative amine oxidase [Cotonvirus japonicus]BCS83488.1 putative amine oxidase [Cotonvirus japonicus]
MVQYKIFGFALVLALLFVGSQANNCKPTKRDVCILGAGAAGMSMAAFLKDRGYDPLVLEQDASIGGHCNTEYFDPPCGEDDDWLDYGVQLYLNTTELNLYGIGSWNVSTEEFINRFAGPDATIPLTDLDSRVYVNMQEGELAIPDVNNTALGIALQIYYGILSQYPWIDDGEYTGPIPQELLMPFSEFAAPFGLEAMAEIFRAFGFNSGIAFGNYTNVPTIHMLNSASRATLQLLSGSPTSSYKVKGGCSAVYNGIREYIGEENVVTNAKVTNVKRTTYIPGKNVKIRGFTTNDQQTENFEYFCDKLVVAFPPVLEKLDFLDTDTVEQDLFSNVDNYYYYAGIADVNGPFVDGKSYQISNSDLTSNFNVPNAPTAISLGRYIRYGPSQVQAISDVQRSVSEMHDIIQCEFENIPVYVASHTNVTKLVQHDSYWPYFNSQSLTQTVSPYATLSEIQGRHNTFWVSALNRYAANSVNIWELTHDVVNEFFPEKC